MIIPVGRVNNYGEMGPIQPRAPKYPSGNGRFPQPSPRSSGTGDLASQRSPVQIQYRPPYRTIGAKLKLQHIKDPEEELGQQTAPY